ncbi:restriction endonuclease subunit S [Roseibacillus persicicus]|uniref:restriction endonuclease subunit S n=1 Tax=Roseibacillus persicicus TaxID=454148 RepID=UPI0016784147|nr:restriction endonuclease subunit S [Roseibacillus persicicus]
MKYPRVSLDSIAIIEMGHSPPGSSYNDLEVGTPLINGPTEFTQTSPVATQWTTLPTKLCESGDILLCVRGNTLGKQNIADSVYCIGRGLAAIRARVDISDQRFLIHTTQYLARDFLNNGAGSTFPNLSGEKLRNFQIPLPPLAEQKRIAAELDEQLASIEIARAAAERQVEAAKALERSLLGAAFPDTTPVRIGYPSDSLPEGWRWQRLLDVARLESGHTPSRRHPEWWGGDIPWIALPDIRKLDGLVALDTRDHPNELGIANSSARILPKNTVVLSRDVVVGFATLLGRDMATSQHFFNWICGDSLLPNFLLHAFRCSKSYLESQASGAIHQTIYVPAAKDMHLALPDLATQQAVVTQLDDQLAAQRETLQAAQTQLKAIQALPAAVLRGVFG